MRKKEFPDWMHIEVARYCIKVRGNGRGWRKPYETILFASKAAADKVYAWAVAEYARNGKPIDFSKPNPCKLKESFVTVVENEYVLVAPKVEE